MGFRNPITTATDVDTSDGSGSGSVQVAGARATFHDAAGSTGYLEAISTNITDPLSSSFHMVGNSGSTTTPEVRMGVKGAPAGGYLSVLSLTADGIAQSVPTDPIIAATALPLTGAYFTPYLGGYRSPTYAKLASGLVVVYGTIKVTSVNFVAGQVVATLPAGCRPLAAERFTLTGWGQTWTADVNNSGAITYVSSGSGASVVVGALLSLSGIQFLGEA